MTSPETWRSASEPPPDDRLVELAWFTHQPEMWGYAPEHLTTSRWKDGHWDGWYTPTHWRPV